jgi:hypothetical protein
VQLLVFLLLLLLLLPQQWQLRGLALWPLLWKPVLQRLLVCWPLLLLLVVVVVALLLLLLLPRLLLAVVALRLHALVLGWLPM